MRSILKTEYIYRQKLKTFQQANELIDEYSHFYNHERLQSLIFSFYPLQISFCTVYTIGGGSVVGGSS